VTGPPKRVAPGIGNPEGHHTAQTSAAAAKQAAEVMPTVSAASVSGPPQRRRCAWLFPGTDRLPAAGRAGLAVLRRAPGRRAVSGEAHWQLFGPLPAEQYEALKASEPGDLVVDPFLGSGTTAACKQLGRRFTGCDIDPAAVATARERVGGAP
jgi:DNA methylase